MGPFNPHIYLEWRHAWVQKFQNVRNLISPSNLRVIQNTKFQVFKPICSEVKDLGPILSSTYANDVTPGTKSSKF